MKIKNGFCLPAILFWSIISLPAQTISVTPDSGSIGNYLTVTITGTDVTFGQGSSCLCPSCVDVSYSKVYFQQGSSTIYPDYSWIVNSNNLAAEFMLNGYYPAGAYNVIVGPYSSCPIVCENCFTINAPPPPINDVCFDAIEVFCGNPTNGSTIGATYDNPDYCFTSIGAPGVWYLFKGTGGLITASTCNFSGYDTKINVYKGMCGSMTCVAGNDDYCGGGSSVTWTSQAGTDYFILVQGYGGGTGDFQLDLSCVTAPVITMSPASVIKGDEMTVTITGTDITFGQGSSCLCPECISVTTSNVVFQQASTTILYPNSINLVNETQFTANFTLDGNIPTGFYDIIVGDYYYYNCRVSCLGCVEVLCNTQMAPVISIIGDTVFCEGNSVELISSSSAGILWSDGSTQQSVTATNSGIYFVEQINDAGCTNSISEEIKIVVNPLPLTPTIIQADDNLVASVTGVSYEWKKDGMILTDTTQVILNSGNGVYEVRVIDANGCLSDFSAPFLMVNLKESSFKDDISIRPNPSQGIFYISLEGNRNSRIEVRVENLMGQTLFTGPLNRFEEKNIISMDLSHLPKGIYFMMIKTSSAMKNYKLLLE